MGTRVKTFDSTGVAPNGRLYAGDLNAMEDQYADLTNLAQALSVGSLAVGEAGLQLVRYGAGEARISGALRTDGILRGLGGIYPAQFSTAGRNGIAAGSRPNGLIIYNTDTLQYEYNSGTDAAPVWIGVGDRSAQELDYAQITSNSANVAVTSEASANTIITGNSITYDGSKVKVEFSAPHARTNDNTSATPTLTFVLIRDTTVIGTGVLKFKTTGAYIETPIKIATFDTPSAGAHTYLVKAYVNSTVGVATSAVIFAGAGGSGADVPAFLRVTRA